MPARGNDGRAIVGWLAAALVLAAVIWWNPVQRCDSPPGAPDAAIVVDGASSRDAAVDAGQGLDAIPAADAPDPIDAADPVDAPTSIDAPALAPFYTVNEALADVQSGPLTFVGTGPWYGVMDINACAYRNQRVIVVHVYCTYKEQPATSILVISPTRGSLDIYAEAGTGPSTTPRADYIDFKLEVTDVPSRDRPALSFTYDELAAWYERTAKSDVGGCSYGMDSPEGGCADSLESRAVEWLESAKPFIDAPPADWYSIAKDLATRGRRDRKRTATR